MDDDDYYTNMYFFEEALKILEEKQNISFVSSNSMIEYVNKNKKEKNIMNISGEINNAQYLLHFQQEYKKSSSTFTTVFRKRNLEKANIQNVEMLNDSTIYLRALLTGNAYILNTISGVYRIHSNNISFNLNADFIIQNLIEKKKVSQEIKKRKILDDTNDWLYKQVMLTVAYYTRETNVKEEEFNKLAQWCKENIEGEMEKNLISYKNKRAKIFIMAYARKNVGDDLFIQMILEKYHEIDFFMKINEYKYLEILDKKYKNLHVLIGEDTDAELYKIDVEEYDGYLYIGGSIFMEGGRVYNLSPEFNNFVVRCKVANKPFCYISSNYGPYQTEEYFNLSRKNFNDCTDICFRDKYSYNLFKDIKNVRYAPDYIFTYKIKEQDKIPNSIGISVVNVENKNNLKAKQEEYIEFLVKNIKKYIEEGNKVYLFSYCKYEGDEVTIDEILKEIPDDKNIVAIRYNGNLEEFLAAYARMEYMICARFHAMVLSCILHQKMYIMSYSNKIDNVVEDLKLDLPIIRLEKLDKDKILDKKEFVLPNETKILEVINEAMNQDKVFEENICNIKEGI